MGRRATERVIVRTRDETDEEARRVSRIRGTDRAIPFAIPNRGCRLAGSKRNRVI